VIFKPTQRAILFATAVSLTLGLTIGASPRVLAATPVEEAQSLISQGDLDGALKRLDRYLASSPQDAEARFTRGLVLVKLNKIPDAIKAFADLTRDYPQLPEPYNNLAVLYAQQGDYEKARDALEAALATHPSYATAHENLGDIYAALAGAAYNRALMLDQANQGVRYKLSLINQLGNGPAGAPATASVAAPSAPVLTPKAPVAVASAPAAAPAPMVAPAPVAPAPAPTVDKAAITAVLDGWAQAWSAKDVDGYLAYYSTDFKPEKGMSRSAWETERHDRVGKAGSISVKVIDPEITAEDPHTVRVSFTQEYHSDTISDKAGKVLELKETGGAWKIVREHVR